MLIVNYKSLLSYLLVGDPVTEMGREMINGRWAFEVVLLSMSILGTAVKVFYQLPVTSRK